MLVSASWRDLPSLIVKDYWPDTDSLSPGPDGLVANSSGFAVHYASLEPVKGQSNVELLAKVKIDTLEHKQGLLVIRGNIYYNKSEKKNKDSGYVLAYQQGVDGITYLKVDYADNTFNQAIGVNKPLEWNWVRFSVKGSTIKAKVWQDGQVEPGWQIVINDTYWPEDSNGSVGIAHFSRGNVTYNYISASTDDRPAPRPGEYADTYINSKPEPEIGYWGAPGLRALGAIWARKKVTGKYEIEPVDTTARIKPSTPEVKVKYGIAATQTNARITTTQPRIVYKEPGKVYILPSTEVARVKISQPALNYKAPPNVNVVGNTTNARITTNLPSITFSSKHAIIADETVARIELPQPTIVFKDVERYTFYVDPITARIRTTTPLVRFKRVQINPDVWKTPQSEVEHEWRKLPYTSEATGAWRDHQYYRSDDQVWRNNRKEDTSQWRKPVSTTRDEQEWRRVVYD
jgi:hypothetical protein